MRVLVWQWGRRGAGPRFAAELVHGLGSVAGVQTLLSLSTGAELLRSREAPICDLYFKTYAGLPGYLSRALHAPLLLPRLERWLRDQRVEVALCAMPAALDLVMAGALRRAGVPFAVVVHDGDRHPGDMFPLQMNLQRRLMRDADGLFALTEHVAARVRAQRLSAPLFMTSHPPFPFGAAPAPPLAHGGPLRVLSFGRLLAYKGLDLLADALAILGPRDDMQVRVVGSGPETALLDRLRALPGVRVENRWVPEDELGAVLAWADVLVLSHREASQSGVAAAALAAGRWVVGTRVGGLVEQLEQQPMALLCEPTGAGVAAALGKLLTRPDPPPAGPAPPWTRTASAMADALRTLRPRTAHPGQGAPAPHVRVSMP